MSEILRIGDAARWSDIVIYRGSDLKDGSILNELWDAWVPTEHLPIRACVQAQLAPGYFVEMSISAAVTS